MKLEDLKPADQKLVQMNFGDEIEKEAAARIELAKECYDYGFSKLASAIADDFDAAVAELEKQAAEEEKDEDEKEKDEESDKTAAELGRFICKGTEEGLRKMGQERRGDEMAYLWPFVEEKVAAKGAMAGLKRLGASISEKAKAGKDFVAKQHAKGVKEVKGAVRPTGKKKPGAVDRALKGVKGVGRLGAIYGTPAAALTAGGAMAMGGKKEE